jgi:hypothetical protein
MAVLAPADTSGQVLSRRTPPPQITAADADWQIRSEPIVHAGFFYYPSGPNVFFDGHTMVRTGSYDGVPLYQDTTIEPHSVILVPIGRTLMRPYERRREGDIAGTVGSRTPAFPVELSGDVASFEPILGLPPPGLPAMLVTVEDAAGEIRALDTLPDAGPGALAEGAATLRRPARGGAATRLDVGDQGVWIEFDGRRWFSAGPARAYEPSRFVRAGSYRGFDVYRDASRPADETIYVRIASEGLLAPYSRRD